MQDILKNACPRFEFILLKAKVNLGMICLNMIIFNCALIFSGH